MTQFRKGGTEKQRAKGQNRKQNPDGGLKPMHIHKYLYTHQLKPLVKKQRLIPWTFQQGLNYMLLTKKKIKHKDKRIKKKRMKIRQVTLRKLVQL